MGKSTSESFGGEKICYIMRKGNGIIERMGNYTKLTRTLEQKIRRDFVKKYFKVLTGAMLVAFLFFCHDPSVYAALITKTLDNDTLITPPGLVVATRDDIPKFKKGTAVTLNMYGEVLEGVLAENISLPYETGMSRDSARATSMYYTPPQIIFVPSYQDKMPTTRVLPFKGGTKVFFNEKGEVIRGTINGPDQRIDLNPSNHIMVAEGEISFHKNGMVAICTLGDDTYLRPVGWSEILSENFTGGAACPGFVEFKAGKPVLLNDKGEVIKGTLKKDTKLRWVSPLSLNAVGIKVFEAGTTVEFDDKGVVLKASKN